MQVILQPLPQSDGSSIPVDINSQATVASLISQYCTLKGIAYSSNIAIFDEKQRSLPQYSTLTSLGITNGQKLLIGYSGKGFTLQEQWPLIVALAALIIGIIGILTISMVYGLTGGKYPYDYGVVMDAGSSKTNTIAYKWKSDKLQGTGVVTQETSCLAKGGVAQMDPMELDKVIDCAQNVTSHIAPENRKNTPLYFAATAGMRLLNLTNPARVDALLGQLRKQLPATQLTLKEVEIISGQDEGIYGWITANFLQQTLEAKQKKDPWEPTTFGALDLGGASTQISYAVPENKSDSYSTEDVTLYGQTHRVFAHSNLCFGRDEAERRYRYLLMKKVETAEIQDPCLPEGFTLTVKGADLFKRPCTESSKFPTITQNPDSYLENYTFVGSSNPSYCQGNVSKLLEEDLCKNYNFKECFKKLSGIPLNQEYLAFSAYYFTTKFLNVTNVTMEEYLEASKNFCDKTWAEVAIINNSSYATQYCFNSMYIYQVLTDGFGFQSTTWKNLNFVGKIAGKDVGWTLGYMIKASNIIPNKKSPKAISRAALTVSLIIFILVIIGTILFLLQQHRKRQEQKYSTGQP